MRQKSLDGKMSRLFIPKKTRLYQVRLISYYSYICAERVKTFPPAPFTPAPFKGAPFRPNDKSLTAHDITPIYASFRIIL